MKLNPNKCFTFGNKVVKACVPDITQHHTQFRLVGGSIKLSSQVGATELELDRRASWQRTIDNIRLLPVRWARKVKVIRSSMAKLTFSQGTHELSLNKDQYRKLRATVIRCLLNESFYDSSPGIIFSVLAPPSLDADLAAFMLIKRMNPAEAHKNRLSVIAIKHGGPPARIVQLLRHPVFHRTMQDFLNNRLDEHKWQHSLREDYRLYNWHKIATDRSQHFQGIENGIKRDLSISLLNKWTQDADNLQNSEDANLSVAIDVKHDPRAKMKILRLLLPAGIQTPERDHRRRKKTGDIVCKCNLGAPTIHHISWMCPIFSQQRAPISAIRTT